jgi:hypothetical protein
LQPSTKKILFAVLVVGALLVAGRFFVGKNKESQTENLKPSQLDFSKTNTLPAAPTATQVTEVPAATEVAVVVSSDQSKLVGADLKVWQSLDAIIKSKNDNDPRINTEMKSLSLSVHEALYEKYNSMPSEDRNVRGLVVFLIARDFKTKADLDFLKKVYDESPCLSLEDCKNVGSDDAHFSGMNQTTLNYPQLAGLYQIEKQLDGRKSLLQDPVFKDGVLAILKQADNFPVPAVQKKSEEVRKKFGL